MINKAFFWDTSGKERTRSIVFKTLKNAQGIILFFYYSNRKTFEYLDIWLDDIKDNLNDDIVIVLSGNKIDYPKIFWQVTSEEAKEYAQKKNVVLFETSAKENIGIKEGFSYTANEVYLIPEKRIEKIRNIIKQNLKKLLKYINF